MNVTLEVLWIRSRAYLKLVLPVLGILLFLYGAFEVFVGPIFALASFSSLYHSLPIVGPVIGFFLALIGVGLTIYTTR